MAEKLQTNRKLVRWVVCPAAVRAWMEAVGAFLSRLSSDGGVSVCCSEEGRVTFSLVVPEPRPHQGQIRGARRR